MDLVLKNLIQHPTIDSYFEGFYKKKLRDDRIFETLVNLRENQLPCHLRVPALQDQVFV
jgi:hypothetical protein